MIRTIVHQLAAENGAYISYMEFWLAILKSGHMLWGYALTVSHNAFESCFIRKIGKSARKVLYLFATDGSVACDGENSSVLFAFRNDEVAVYELQPYCHCFE